MNIRSFAKLLVRRPRTVIFVFTIITVLVGSQATNIYMESNFTSYLPENDTSLKLWKEISDEFELGSTIIILIDQTKKSEDVRDSKVLNEMDEIYRILYEKPLENGKETGIKSINSLAVLIKKENGESPIPPIGRKPGGLGGTGSSVIPPDTEDGEKDIRAYMERPSVAATKGVLYTTYFNYAVIIIQLENGVDYNEVLTKTEQAIKNRGTTHANMEITGTIAMQKAIQENSMENLVIVFPVALVLVSIVLFFFHRSFKGIIIAFLPPAFALALTFGTLGAVKPELSIISVAVVALLMGLGVDYSIHLMNRLVEEKTLEDKITKVEKTLKSTGKAVLLSTITTFIGFGSLMISSMSPMVAFGFASAIGILFCFASAIVLVPCLVMILKFDKVGRFPSWKKFANFAINNRGRIIIVAVFFAVISILLLPQVETDVNFLELSPEGIPEVEAMNKYSDVFGGGANFNALIIETDPYGFTDREVIRAIIAMEDEMRDAVAETFPNMDTMQIEKSVYSIADEIDKALDLVEQINQSAIRQFIEERFISDASKILLDRISREGYQIIDEEYSKTLIMVSIPAGISIQKTEELVNKINLIAEKTNSVGAIPKNGKVSQLAGQDAVNVAVNKKLTDEQTRSMIIALLLVLSVLIVIFNSSKYGFLTLIPVAFVLLWEPGFLVGLDISLSVVTITIASIMIGIGIDYGVHITQRVRDGLEEGLSKVEATREAIDKTGLSLLEAALTTMAGISAIYFINIPALRQFGTVIVLMTALSCIAAALILPVFYASKKVNNNL